MRGHRKGEQVLYGTTKKWDRRKGINSKETSAKREGFQMNILLQRERRGDQQRIAQQTLMKRKYKKRDFGVYIGKKKIH